MEEKKERATKHRLGMMIVTIVGLIAIVVGVSYAWFTISLQGSKTQVIKTGSLELTLDESASDGIMLNNAMPIADFDGMNTTSYKFTLKNTGDMDSNYELKLTDQAITGTRMPDRVVKYWFVKDGEETGPALLNTVSDRIFDRGILKSGASVSYELKVWIDYNAGNEIQGTQFNTKITVDGSQIVPTDENCFTFSDGKITDYNCYPNNANGLPEITDVVIPSEINGVPVTSIGEWAFLGNQLIDVVFPETVEVIRSMAFQNNQLSSIVIPASVKEIHWASFAINNLEKVVIKGKSSFEDFDEFGSSHYCPDVFDPSVCANIIWEP